MLLHKHDTEHSIGNHYITGKYFTLRHGNNSRVTIQEICQLDRIEFGGESHLHYVPICRVNTGRTVDGSFRADRNHPDAYYVGTNNEGERVYFRDETVKPHHEWLLIDLQSGELCTGTLLESDRDTSPSLIDSLNDLSESHPKAWKEYAPFTEWPPREWDSLPLAVLA